MLRHGWWWISFHTYNYEDEDRGFEIWFGRHYKVPWKYKPMGFYWTCRKKIAIGLPCIRWPNRWFYYGHAIFDSLNFDKSGAYKPWAGKE